MLFKCKCGSIYQTTFSHFKDSNQRQCKECGYKITANKLKFTFKEVKEYIEGDSGCELLSNSYISQLDKLQLRCNCGNIFYKTFKDFKNGQIRCNDCSGKFTYTIDDVKEYVKKHSSCELLSSIYKNQYKKLKFRCSCGNIFYRTFNDLKNQKAFECPVCSKGKSKNEKKIKELLKN